MASEIITVQASTAVSKPCFSLASRILDKKMSRLDPIFLEIYICYKNYLDVMTWVRDSNLLIAEPDWWEEQGEDVMGQTMVLRNRQKDAIDAMK